MVDQIEGFANAKIHGSPDLHNEQTYPEDQRTLFALEIERGQLNLELARRTADTERARQEIETLSRALERQQTDLAEQTADAERLRQETMNLGCALGQQQDRCRDLASALASATEEISSIKATRSWRWSAPLRSVGQAWDEGAFEPVPIAYLFKREFYRAVRRPNQAAKYDSKLKAAKRSGR
jgi:chromosome segregation ATPase